MPGVDGLKTGFTKNAGYCLTATGIRNNIRFISVVMGVDNTNNRSKDTTDLLNYGFNNYKINKVISKETDVGTIKVEKGKQEEVELLVTNEINELIANNAEVKEYEYVINVPKVITAPIFIEDVIGTVDIKYNDEVIYTADVTPSEEVEKESLGQMFLESLKIILCSKK